MWCPKFVMVPWFITWPYFCRMRRFFLCHFSLFCYFPSKLWNQVPSKWKYKITWGFARGHWSFLFYFILIFFINSFDEFNLVLNTVGWIDNPTQFDPKNLKLRCGRRLKFNRLDFGQLKNPKKSMHTQVICDTNF